jgi:hypothetical protein
MELKDVTTRSNNTGTILSRNIPRHMPFLWGVVSVFLSSIVVLTTNGQFLDCATIAFSERFECSVKMTSRMESKLICNNPLPSSALSWGYEIASWDILGLRNQTKNQDRGLNFCCRCKETNAADQRSLRSWQCLRETITFPVLCNKQFHCRFYNRSPVDLILGQLSYLQYHTKF